MQIQLFTFSKPFFSATWKIDPVEVGTTISNWLRRNPDIDVITIKHTAITSFMYPSQLFVSIYYR
jgi:hypothetical protein